MAGYLLLFIVLAALFVSVLGVARGKSRRAAAAVKTHSRPIYHGLNAAIWAGVPAFVFLLLWLLFQNSVIDALVLASFPGVDAMTGPERDLVISEIRQVAAGNIFKEPTAEVTAAVAHLKSLQALAMWAMVALTAALVAIGAFFGLGAIHARFRARHSVERSVTWFMMF